MKLRLELDDHWLYVSEKNHKLTEFEDRFIRATLAELVNLAPMDSSFILEIIGLTDLFEVRLKIVSSAEEFECAKYGKDVCSTMSLIKLNILKQLEKWKSTRFNRNIYDMEVV